MRKIEGKAARVVATELGQRRSFNRGKELARASYQAAVIASGYSFRARASHSDAATSSEFQKEDRNN